MRLNQKVVTRVAAAVFVVVAVLLGGGVYIAGKAVDTQEEAAQRQIEFKQLGLDLAAASDFLTDEARKYSVTGDEKHLQAYWNEIEVTKTRDRVLTRLKELGSPQNEFDLVDEAKRQSDALVSAESRSMRLVLEAQGVPEASMPAAIAANELDAADQQLTPEEKLETAARIMFDAQYAHDKALITTPMDEFQETMNARAEAQVEDARESAETAMAVLTVLAVIVPVLVSAMLFFFHWTTKRGLAPVLDRLRMLKEHCVTDLRSGLERMATGDLTVEVVPVTPPIEQISKDQIGEVALAVNEIRERTVASVEAYNGMRSTLHALVGQVSSTGALLGSASQQMAATSEETGRAVGEIAHAVSDVAAGAERQVKMVEQARSSSEETAQAAEEARQLAGEGVGAAAKASQAMRAVRESSVEVSEAIRTLSAKSEQIGGIVQTITGIAGQTNLLALNAAIEAARAGEQGRGFAVVAEEVRKLAEESQQAAATIASLIEEIQAETQRTVSVVEDSTQRTEDGAVVVEQTRAAFERIGESVEAMGARVQEIAGAMSEVASVAEQSSASSEEVSASTEQTSASTQEIAASAQQLADTAEELNRLVGQFRLAG
jgi:methyl-accepting chemotaxis protein